MFALLEREVAGKNSLWYLKIQRKSVLQSHNSHSINSKIGLLDTIDN